MSNIDINVSLGDLVTQQQRYARVFESLGLDFCCGGKKSLAAACEEKGLNPGEVIRMLDNEAHEEEPREDVSALSPTELVDHIERTHHVYMRAALPRLSSLSEKVASAHAEAHQELLEVRDVIEALRADLEQHLLKEEMILFPLIRQMDSGEHEAASFHCGSVEAPISRMEFEHDAAGAMLARLRSLTSNYAAPADACPTYVAFLKALSELEQDLHLHVHKENNILFPRAIELEAKSCPME